MARLKRLTERIMLRLDKNLRDAVQAARGAGESEQDAIRRLLWKALST